MDTTKENTEMKTYCPPQIEKIEIDKEFSLFSPLVPDMFLMKRENSCDGCWDIFNPTLCIIRICNHKINKFALRLDVLLD